VILVLDNADNAARVVLLLPALPYRLVRGPRAGTGSRPPWATMAPGPTAGRPAIPGTFALEAWPLGDRAALEWFGAAFGAAQPR
jgi:hypothetical protein